MSAQAPLDLAPAVLALFRQSRRSDVLALLEWYVQLWVEVVEGVLDSLLVELFGEMRAAGMALTMEQFGWLRAAVAKGYGLGGWEDLERVCRRLWVRPTPEYAPEKFNRAFERVRQRYAVNLEPPPPQIPPTPIQERESSLPQVPLRRFPAPELPTPSASPAQIPAGVQVDSSLPLNPQGRRQFSVQPQKMPVSLAEARMLWRLMRRPQRSGLEVELDLGATLREIQRQGHFGDVVLRPVRSRRAELVLLIDDSNVMQPFRPAIAPFLQAIKKRWIAPARVYRFTTYPDDSLYDWENPFRAEPLATLLPQWHRDRTIVLVWSEAGAALGTDRAERVTETVKVLQQLQPCVRQVLWVNPLPPRRWERTSAAKIARALGGQMVPLEAIAPRATSMRQLRVGV